MTTMQYVGMAMILIPVAAFVVYWLLEDPMIIAVLVGIVALGTYFMLAGMLWEGTLP